MLRQITIATVLLIIDRAAKALAFKQLFSNSWFTLFLNDGVVFSILPSTPIIIILSILVLIAVFLALVKFPLYTSQVRWALLLIAAGASSNIYDRLIHETVIDYLYLGGGAVFNLADVYILIGATILIFNFILIPQRIDKTKILG